MKEASSQLEPDQSAEDNDEIPSDIARVSAAFRKINEANRDLVHDISSSVFSIPVVVHVVIGTTRLPISKLLSLEAGSVIDLDQKVGEPVDLVINDKVIARGELGVLEGDDPSLFVTITELVPDALA